MATLYVAEFATLGSSGAQVVMATPLAEQVVAIGGSSASSARFGGATRFIRVHTDSVCSILVGASPTATTTQMRLSADQTEYFGVQPGDKIAVITNT